MCAVYSVLSRCCEFGKEYQEKQRGVVLTSHLPCKRRGHERVELYLHSPSGPSWPVIGRTFTFTFISGKQNVGLCSEAVVV